MATTNDMFERTAPRCNQMAHMTCPDGREILLTDGDTVAFATPDGDLPQRRVRLRLLSDTDVAAVEVDPAVLIGVALHFANPDGVMALCCDLIEQSGDEASESPDATIAGQTLGFGPETPDDEIPRPGWVCDVTAVRGEIRASAGDSVWRAEDDQALPQRRMNLRVIGDSRMMAAEVSPIVLIAGALRFVAPESIVRVLDQMTAYHAQHAGAYQPADDDAERRQG